MITDPDLYPKGEKKIEWVRGRMPVMRSLAEWAEKEQPFRGEKIAICLHLEAKTAYMALAFSKAGGQVAICGSNPLSTQDDVAAALVRAGIRVSAWRGATMEEYKTHLARTAAWGPDLLIDDGGDLVQILHTEYGQLLDGVFGGSEETTTGVNRLQAMEKEGNLAFPMFAANDARSKYLFDNRYGTGQSTWDGIMRTTNLVVAGKDVVVCGYGWCGRGIAMRAAGLGARVIVCEIDPVRANEALMDGYRVMTMGEAAKLGDIFITATGCRDVIRHEHFAEMKDGALLCNAGHFDLEINKEDLLQLSVKVREVRENITGYILPDGRTLCLLAEGRLVNLAAGDGHPAEIMDMSFALQFLTLDYIKKNKDELTPGVYRVPAEVDERVARSRLEALGVEIDSLNKKQRDYLESWR